MKHSFDFFPCGQRRWSKDWWVGLAWYMGYRAWWIALIALFFYEYG